MSTLPVESQKGSEEGRAVEAHRCQRPTALRQLLVRFGNTTTAELRKPAALTRITAHKFTATSDPFTIFIYTNLYQTHYVYDLEYSNKNLSNIHFNAIYFISFQSSCFVEK